MHRPSRFVLVVDTLVGEEVVDLTLKDAQAPVTIFRLGLETAFRLHEPIDDTGSDERLPPGPKPDFRQVSHSHPCRGHHVANLAGPFVRDAADHFLIYGDNARRRDVSTQCGFDFPAGHRSNSSASAASTP